MSSSLALRDNFWDRWQTDYLYELLTRYKWNKSSPNIKEGSLIFITSETAPPTEWLLARVIKIYLGDDGLVRTVTLKTDSSELKRLLSKLVLLPIARENRQKNGLNVKKFVHQPNLVHVFVMTRHSCKQKSDAIGWVLTPILGVEGG